MSALSISILIPVYNWDISELLKRLHDQTDMLQESCAFEIIAVEDGSKETFENEQIAESLKRVSYTSLPHNHGRATLRNLLLQRANGEYVLFLDADMLPDDENFLHRYVEKAESGSDIVCGGISYKQVLPTEQQYSFYLYKSLKTEAISAERRLGSAWRYLFTSNVLVRRDVTESVNFDLRFASYGFEDIDWAIRLAKSYTIQHIDNTCSHMGLMTKPQAFIKMRESIDNYALLLSLHPEETASSQITRLSRLMQWVPGCILDGIDTICEKLFYRFSRNSVAFIFFQLDKLVLLTRTLKSQKNSGTT